MHVLARAGVCVRETDRQTGNSNFFGPMEFKKYIFLFPRIEFVLANSADLNEMPHNAAFLLGLHCLSKYPS